MNPAATHRCKICKALWRLNPPDPNALPGSPLTEESWSVTTPDIMGKCCDNVAMGDQIEPLDRECSCTLHDLMQKGCKCGGR